MSKWTPKFSKKKHVAHSIPEKSEAPEEPESTRKKSEIRPGYYLRSLPVYKN